MESKKPGYMGLAIGAGDALTTGSAINGIYSKEELGSLMRRDQTGGIPAAILFNKKPIVLSPKLRDCIRNMLSIKGKQYVYTINKSTVYTIMQTLMDLGYTPVTPRNVNDALSSPGKRFLYYKAGAYTFGGKIIKVKELGKEGSISQLKGKLEDKKNINGDYIKICIASDTYYQGLSINGLTGIHILDPVHDQAADIQALGRALRLCGHAKAASKQATIFRYFSTVPRTFTRDGVSKKQLPELEKLDKEIRRLNTNADFSMTNGGPRDSKLPEGVNTFVFADAVRLNTAVAQTERLLKAEAIDCPLYKDLFHSTENFKCGVPTKVDLTGLSPSKSSASKKLPPGAKSPSGLLQLSPLTPRSSSSKKSSSPKKRLTGVKSASLVRSSPTKKTSRRRAKSASVGERRSTGATPRITFGTAAHRSSSPSSSRSSGSVGSSSPTGVIHSSGSSGRK
jgi:hypothetical protein